MNPLDRQWFYRGFRKALRDRLGREKAGRVWAEAGKEYRRILETHPGIMRQNGAMTVPAVAIWRALEAAHEDAGALLNAYGDEMGRRLAGLVHALTSLPGVDRLIWRHAGSLSDRMSSERHGYARRLVSDPPGMYGVDILSCPYHEMAKALGSEGAVLCICHMDKAYARGFRHIRYERHSSVAEGADCCAYRLRFDPEKK